MEVILGSIIIFGGNFVPEGFAPCNGALLHINQNQALFAILGNQYGGDGINTFALPQLPDLGGAQYLIATQGVFPMRS